MNAHTFHGKFAGKPRVCSHYPFIMAVQQPRGTKRAYDTMIGIMDLYYKQENDALLVENRKMTVQVKKLKKTVDILQRLHRIQDGLLGEARHDATVRQHMLARIYEHFPEVRALFTFDELDEDGLETEEEFIDSDAEEVNI